MDLYMIRHAEAAPLGEGGTTDDEQRPLTDLGRQQARALGTGLSARGVAFPVLVTSPLLRARQTAEGLLANWHEPGTTLRVALELAPGGKRRKLARYLAELGTASAALVGHQPDLGAFLGWLIGERRIGIDLAKAGVALVRCDGKPAKGSGDLVWLVTPDWLTS